jgi:DNA polymerase I-like protein with 3'-5' exonuclease and polymerase domains
MYPDLSKAQVVSLDTETTGLHFKRDRMFGFSIAVPGHAWYYDIRGNPGALKWLRKQTRYQMDWVFFNATFDLKMLANENIHFNPDKVDDAAIRACLINEHLGNHNYTLDSLSRRYLGEGKHVEIYSELAGLFGGLATKGVQMPNLQKAPSSLVSPYAILDARRTFDLYQWQNKEIERQELQQICAFERRTIREVLAQETNGVRVDVEAALRAKSQLEVIIDREQAALDKLVGRPFNVNSSPQIRDYFKPHKTDIGWVLANGYPCGTTENGNPSIDIEVLQSISDVDPVAEKISAIRGLIRTADTFLGVHILESSVDGKVYPNINQVASEKGGTKFGRFSYTDPALQQIPSRNKEVARIVKSCFLPDEGQDWLDGDMHSFEVRVFGHLVGAFDPSIARIYEQEPNTDFHQWVADLMNVPRDPPKNKGANAKQLNLSMIFNSGNGSIARQLGYQTSPASFVNEDGETIYYHKPDERGMRVINAYHAKMRGVKKLVDAAKDRCKKVGYLKTMYGRHLRFPQKSKYYKASGILIQATAADINKHNWHLISDVMDGRGRLILNTHDNYSISVEKGKGNKVWKDVKHAIETAERPHALRVPLVLKRSGCGPNWWEALQG